MKIKTITCHDVYNAGASLQAYALSIYLTSLGHEVEIINYKPDYLSRHYPLFGVTNPAYDKPFLREAYNLLKLPRRIQARKSQRKKEFDAFTKIYLPLTKERYSTFEQLKQACPQADLYFAGSDQIWNCLFQNGKDPSFYLAFVPDNCLKASYAASFSTETIPQEWQQQVYDWISRLDCISVREKSGVSILKELGIDRAIQVLDPVFLLSSEEWNRIGDEITFEEPYIFLYDFDLDETLGQSIRRYATENRLRIYSYLPNKYCDRSFADYGPKTFISLVKNANLVISNSFHATAFSLIFEKEFWVLRRKENINTRMEDLLNMVGLKERMLVGKMISDDMYIDYNCVRENLKEHVNDSKKYIDLVIEKAKEK